MIDLSKIIQGKKLTDTEREVLAYIVENIDTVLEKGVRTVAKENYTSPSTVMRLTKKLGYQGFVDLYYNLEPLVKERKQREGELGWEISYNPLVELAKLNPVTKIREFTELLQASRAQSVFLYATGFSASIAEYMYKKLLVNGQRTLFASGMDSIGILESNVKSAGVFVTITKSGETASVVEKMRYFKEQGIVVVTFTNELPNTASELADIVFRIPDPQKLDDRNITANYFFAEALLLFERIMQEYQAD